MKAQARVLGRLAMRVQLEARVRAQAVVCAGASAGEIEGTATISRGTWYGVLVARTAAGESVASQEFQFVSEKRHQGVIVVIK